MTRKDALLRLHQNLLAKRDALRRQLANELNLSQTSNSGSGDVCDAALDGTQSELHSQLAALESRELNQIDQAIQMIREGRYGLCEVCGEKIPVARLKALPYTPLCINCQRKQEVRGSNRPGLDLNWESAYEYEGATNDREISIGDIELDL
jgi:DnaK suppressor protein